MLNYPGIGFVRRAAASPIVASALVLLVLLLIAAPVAAQDIRYTTVGSNVRTGPGLEHPVAAVLPAGTAVEVVGRNADGTWLQLRPGNWIFDDLVATRIAGGPETNVAANVRSGPGLDHPVARVLPAGTPLRLAARNRDGTWLQLGSGGWIFAGLVTSVPDGLPVHGSDAPAPAAPLPATPAPATGSPEGLDLQALRNLHLQDINELRTAGGLSALRLAAPGAAQEHADELVAGRYASHWDRFGLTPYMRHSRAGAHGASSENLAYTSYTRPPGVCGTAEVDGRIRLADALKGLINSPGHLETLMMREATTVRIGLAQTCNQFALVQVIGHELIEWMRTPWLDDNRVLRLEGRIDPSTRLGSDAHVVVAWEALPQPIPVAVLEQSRCYSLPRRVAIAVRKAPSGSKARLGAWRCPDPWRAGSQGADGWRETYELPVQQAHRWEVGVTTFGIALDLRDTISQYGDGVYTISVWGTSHKELTELGRHALVVGGPPGHGW